MKIYNYDISKAYLGSLPLNSKNAYIGNYKMIDGDEPGPEPVGRQDYFYYENADENEIQLQVVNANLIAKQGLEYSRDMKTWQSMPYTYYPELKTEIKVSDAFDMKLMLFAVRATTTATAATSSSYWNPETCSVYYRLAGTFTFGDKDDQSQAAYTGASLVSGSYTYYLYCIPEVTYDNYRNYTSVMRIALYSPNYKPTSFTNTNHPFAPTSSHMNLIFQWASESGSSSWRISHITPGGASFASPSANFTSSTIMDKTMEVVISAHWDADPVSLNVGQKLYLRNKEGQEIHYGYGETGYRGGFIDTYYKHYYSPDHFEWMKGALHNIGGNIQTIFDYNITELIERSGDMNGLFAGDVTLISAENLSFDQYDTIGYNGGSGMINNNGYNMANMFQKCEGLEKCPKKLPKIMSYSLYGCSNMFNGCINLTAAPEVSTDENIKGADYCCNKMFYGCSKLVDIHNINLAATTLATLCYSYMFLGCKDLTTAPELPATTLADSCYRSMFNSCSSLATAPELPATTLVNLCYYFMFVSCSKLVEATVYATEWDSSSTTTWLSGVASIGTLYNLGGADIPTDSQSGCPTGWTIETTKP